MANGFPPVQPGDLITSSQWNSVLDGLEDALSRLATLEGGIGAGTETVPGLFGRTLSQARAILQQPSSRLSLGRVLDAHGATITPGLPTVQGRLVIGQLPPPGARVGPGSTVDLVVAGLADGGGTQPTPGPQIIGFNQAQTAILQPVVILGSNFDPVAANNQVTFDSVPTAAPPTEQSTTNSLFVRVPEGIPGAPTAPGDTLDVEVRVTTPTGTATRQHTIEPPLAAAVPVIDNIDTAPNPTGVVGQPLTINGSNFSTTPSENVVRFGSTSATPSTASATELRVTVPESLPSLPTPGSFAFFNVVVEVRGVPSDPVTPPLMIQRP